SHTDMSQRKSTVCKKLRVRGLFLAKYQADRRTFRCRSAQKQSPSAQKKLSRKKIGIFIVLCDELIHPHPIPDFRMQSNTPFYLRLDEESFRNFGCGSAGTEKFWTDTKNPS
ncbi:MAG: hypothetical protein KDE58_31710, partial [Caldilineaceae bacterium]|nr:hypothetical protein [Caldilineaceae bacterium]